MLRRTLIAAGAALCLAGPALADSTEAAPKLDPQNTVYLDLTYGRVVIRLRPDLFDEVVEV